MTVIKSFKAVRPKPELAKDVAALPYDVMSSAEARVMAKDKPYSFLHVSHAEIDLPPSIDEHAQLVYDKARENFYGLINTGTLVQDGLPQLYIYAQVMNGRRQVGLVACSSVEDYFNDVIKKHEFTRPEKELDRINHMQTIQAHVGPIFLTYKAHQTVDEIVNSFISNQAPVNDFISEDGIQHTVWVIGDEAIIQQLIHLFETEVPCTYIADGHHRAASAAKVSLAMQEKNPAHKSDEEYNFFLSVLFPHDQLAIMDYNRLVKDLNGLNEKEFLKKAEEKFHISPIEYQNGNKPEKLHDIWMYLGGKWLLLTPKFEIPNDPIGVLDVSILQENLLNPILGIVDQRTDKRIDFVGGIRGLQALQQRVDSGEMKVAFAIYPVSLEQLMDIADSGNVMPPKSTWFEPKLRDGLFSHLF